MFIVVLFLRMLVIIRKHNHVGSNKSIEILVTWTRCENDYNGGNDAENDNIDDGTFTMLMIINIISMILVVKAIIITVQQLI